MAEAEDKQETIREIKPLSRQIRGTRNRLVKVAKNVPCIIFDLSWTSSARKSVHPLFHNVKKYPVANRLAKMNLSSNLTCGQNIFNKEPAYPEMVRNFYYLMIICSY